MNERTSKEKEPQRPGPEAAPDVEPRHHEKEDDDTFDRESRRRRFDEEAQHPPGQPPA